MPLAFLLGNGTGVPATFILLTLVMLAFSAGYVAMSRHVINAGAFYAYAARGLGGGWGGAVSIIALVAYNAMQFGLIGLLGGVSAGVFSQFGLNLAWWVYSLIAILLVGVLGYRQVDLSAKVMVVLVALEYLIVLIVDFAILGAGGAEGTGLAVNIFDFSAISSGSLTAAVLFCLGSFIGIEATTIYGEEARDPDTHHPARDLPFDPDDRRVLRLHHLADDRRHRGGQADGNHRAACPIPTATSSSTGRPLYQRDRSR